MFESSYEIEKIAKIRGEELLCRRKKGSKRQYRKGNIKMKRISVSVLISYLMTFLKVKR